MDGRLSLSRRLRRSERRRSARALLLVLPMLAFLMVTFLAPIARMLYRSVEDPEMAIALPATAKLLRSWNGQGLPPETVFQSLAEEMPKAADARTLAALAQRLNHDVSGMRSLVLTTARTISRLPSADRAEALKNSDSRWQDPVIWAALRRAAFPITDFHLLTALDLDHDAEGRIVAMPPEESVFLRVMARTLAIGLSVTALCLVLGFPVAYLLARLPSGTSNLLMIFVLLPFWTSLLVRTSAWIVLLQNEGIVNGLLLAAGLVDQPVQMIFNRFGVYVAMTHVLLPFMILPLYSVMKGISPLTQRAAASLGAPPAVAFVRVYLPQTLPGVAAGCLLVFILALGYYITPALVGGADDQMISAFIAFYTIRSVNWGLAAALAALLLLGTLVLYAIYSRFARAGGVRLG